MKHFTAGKLRFPGKPFRRYKIDGRLLVANISHHAADKPVMFPEQLERLQDALINQAEIRSPWRNVYRRKGI